MAAHGMNETQPSSSARVILAARSSGGRRLFRGVCLGMLLCMCLGSVVVWQAVAMPEASGGVHPLAAPGQAATASPTSSESSASSPTESTVSPAGAFVEQAIYYEARSGGHSHLWAYIPGDSRSLQLTAGDWDDRRPAVSPDGTQLAFASNRGGSWDLYVLDLATGDVRALTTTASYEGHPTWSPDGMWIACEAYVGGELDVWILSVAGTQAPIQLGHPGFLDRSPAWDPSGRRIAFAAEGAVSSDIFFANLDDPDNRFVNLTHTPEEEDSPAFSPDGTRLAYAVNVGGMERVKALVLTDGEAGAEEVGQGGEPAWSPDGDMILAVGQRPNESGPIVYRISGEGPLPGLRIESRLASASWSRASVRPVAVEGVGQAPGATPSAPSSTPALVPLEGVTAPRAVLSDRAAAAFAALRERAATEAGWDFLSSLDQAMVGLNDPLPPGFSSEDWLYSGRAFAFNSEAMRAGWVEVVPEEIEGRLYWRVYVRTVVQDGRRGMPLRHRPWDFAARYAGDPAVYDAGGAPKNPVPEGYYVDFTELAGDHGFERLPALSNWRSFYPGAMFNEFVRRDGLTWREAVLELYPAEAIVTPTPFRTPTLTATRTPWPTATPWWMRWRTATPRATSTPAGPT